MCDECRHDALEHDGSGCTVGIGASECLCTKPLDLILGPPTEAAPTPMHSVDELDALHDHAGLGDLWRKSSARTDAIAKQAGALVLPWCPVCQACAVPHTHENTP